MNKETKTKNVEAVSIKNKSVLIEGKWFKVLPPADKFIGKVQKGENEVGFNADFEIQYIRTTKPVEDNSQVISTLASGIKPPFVPNKTDWELQDLVSRRCSLMQSVDIITSTQMVRSMESMTDDQINKIAEMVRKLSAKFHEQITFNFKGDSE